MSMPYNQFACILKLQLPMVGWQLLKIQFSQVSISNEITNTRFTIYLHDSHETGGHFIE